MDTSRKERSGAFSLVELSVVLAILGIMAAGALTVGSVMVEQQQFTGTNERVAEARKAITDYFAINGRLPCPARMDVASGATGFGTEAACNSSSSVASGTWRTGSASTNYNAANGVRIGALPVRTLGLRDVAMSDEYGNRIWYAMSETFGKADNTADAVAAITLLDGNGNAIATPTTGADSPGAAFITFSTGPGGKGGYRYKTGVATSTACSGGLDTENCNKNASFRDTQFNNGNVVANFFDDIVSWMPKYLLTTSGNATARAADPDKSVQFNNNGALAGSANFIWDAASNRLGLGTSSPSGSLHVKNTGGQAHLIVEGSGSVTNAATISLFNTTLGNLWWWSNRGTTGQLMLQHNDGSVWSTHMVFEKDTSKIGMGSITPLEQLDVNGDIYVRGDTVFFSNDGTTNTNNDYMQYDDANSYPRNAGVMSFWADTTRERMDWENATAGVAASVFLGKAIAINNTDATNRITFTDIGDITDANAGGGVLIEDVQDDATGAKLRIDANEMQAAANGAASGFRINPFGGVVYIGSDAFPVPFLRVYGTGGTCTIGSGTGTTSCTSDERLKKNITPLKGALEKVAALQGVSFDWKRSGEHAIGLIAQNVERTYPEIVSTDEENGMKSIAYASLVAPLVEAVKELKTANDALRHELDELKAEGAAAGGIPPRRPDITLSLLIVCGLQVVLWVLLGLRVRRLQSTLDRNSSVGGSYAHKA